jgi:hypothetical protein
LSGGRIAGPVEVIIVELFQTQIEGMKELGSDAHEVHGL